MVQSLESASPPARPMMHWLPWHSLSVIGLTGFFIWMAFWLPWGLYVSWLVAMAALSLFALIVGRGVTGAWKGAFVDERLRMSLSRLQLVAWTVLIVAAFGSIAIARAQVDPETAMNIAVPETVWILLGISTTSLIGSPLIKSAKKAAPVNDLKAASLVRAQGTAPDTVTWEGQVVKNKAIAEASLADLFQGEYVNNFALLDVGKIQLFFFTILLLLAYGAAIAASLKGGEIPSSLPDVGSGMLPLLGISHASYLMSKVASAPSAETTGDPVDPNLRDSHG